MAARQKDGGSVEGRLDVSVGTIEILAACIRGQVVSGSPEAGLRWDCGRRIECRVPVPPTKNMRPSGSRIAGPISLILTATGGFTVVSCKLSKARFCVRVAGVLSAGTHVSLAGTYFSANAGDEISTVRIVPSCSNAQVSSSIRPTLLGLPRVPKASPDSVQESTAGSQMAVRLDDMSPNNTRPSSRMQPEASPLMKLKDAGLFIADQAFVSGSKTSPSGVLFPASEYSPPTTNTLPSNRTPEA